MTIWELLMALFFFANIDHNVNLQILGAIGGMFGGFAWVGSFVVMLLTAFQKPEDSIENELRAATRTSGAQ